MIEVKVDEQELETLYMNEIRKHLEKIEKTLVFWDTAELKRVTCMSWNTIQNTFFYHEDFPKFKIGGKWYFPAEETKSFLLKWLKESGE